ncbi:Ig-like domain-containing protein, partial [Christiangramia sp. SM2212]
MKEITIKQFSVLYWTLEWLRKKVNFSSMLFLIFMLYSFIGFSQTYKDEIRQLKNLDYVTSGLTDDLIFINSNLQANNSAYSEGMSTLQRIIFENLPPAVANEHTLRIRIQTLKGGKHAYDFITSWEQSMKVANTILPPGFVSLPDPGSNGSHPAYSYDEYDDLACGPNITSTAEVACVAADISGNQQFLPIVQDEIANPNVDGSLDNSTRAAVIEAYESVYGDRFVKVKGDMPFTGTAGDPNSRVTFAGFDGEYMFYDISWVSASSSIIIEFGAQIAAGFSPTGVYSKEGGYSIPADGIVGYGPGRGASDVSGAPYHVKFTAFLTDFVDGKAPTLGSQDNQLMADGVRLIPFCDLQGQQSFCLDEISGSVTYDGNATNLEGATYAWSFKSGTNTSNASFDGATDGPTVDVNPGDQEGGYTLVFRVTNDSGLFAECEIDVSISTATIDDEEICASVDGSAGSVTLNYSGTPADSTPFESDNTGVATVTDLGVVSAVSSGTANITYTDSNGCQAIAIITVNANPDADISTDGVCDGDDSVFTATPSDGDNYLFFEDVNDDGAYDAADDGAALQNGAS